MASIKEEGTRGKRLSYKIRVCLGRDENGISNRINSVLI